MHQIRFRLRSLGLTALPQTPWLDLTGLLLRGGKGKKGGEGGEGRREGKERGREGRGGERKGVRFFFSADLATLSIDNLACPIQSRVPNLKSLAQVILETYLIIR